MWLTFYTIQMNKNIYILAKINKKKQNVCCHHKVWWPLIVTATAHHTKWINTTKSMKTAPNVCCSFLILSICRSVNWFFFLVFWISFCIINIEFFLFYVPFLYKCNITIININKIVCRMIRTIHKSLMEES